MEEDTPEEYAGMLVHALRQRVQMLPPRQLVSEGDTRPNTNGNYGTLKLDAEARWKGRFGSLLRDLDPAGREALKVLDYRGLSLRWLALDDRMYLAGTYIQYGMLLDIHLHPAITEELARFSASLEILVNWDREGQQEGVDARWIRFDTVRVPDKITVVDLRVVQGLCPNVRAILGGGHPCVNTERASAQVPPRKVVQARRAARPRPVTAPIQVQPDSDTSDGSDMFYHNRQLFRARVTSSSPSRDRERKVPERARRSHTTPPARPVDYLRAADADGIVRTISEDGIYFAYRLVNDDTLELLDSDEEEAAFQALLEAD